MKQLTEHQARLLYDSRVWEAWSAAQVVRFQLFHDQICVPFAVFLAALDETLKRDVYPTETAPSGRAPLTREYLKTHDEPTFEELMQFIPPTVSELILSDRPIALFLNPLSCESNLLAFLRNVTNSRHAMLVGGQEDLNDMSSLLQSVKSHQKTMIIHGISEKNMNQLSYDLPRLTEGFFIKNSDTRPHSFLWKPDLIILTTSISPDHPAVHRIKNTPSFSRRCTIISTKIHNPSILQPEILDQNHPLFRPALSFISNKVIDHGPDDSYQFLDEFIEKYAHPDIIDIEGTKEFMRSHGAFNDIEIMLNVLTKFT